MKRKLLALTLALLTLTGALAGCGQKTTETSPVPETAAPETSAPAETTAPAGNTPAMATIPSRPAGEMAEIHRNTRDRAVSTPVRATRPAPRP